MRHPSDGEESQGAPTKFGRRDLMKLGAGGVAAALMGRARFGPGRGAAHSLRARHRAPRLRPRSGVRTPAPGIRMTPTAWAETARWTTRRARSSGS